jgi:hypothetical protein
VISELGQRHVERMREGLEEYDRGAITLHQLIALLEALLGLLLEEADPMWVGEMEAECNRLEFAYAAAIDGERCLSRAELDEVGDAIRQLRLMLTRY